MSGTGKRKKDPRTHSPSPRLGRTGGPTDTPSFAQASAGGRTRGPREKDAPIRIHPTFRHYAWGDSEFIPALTGVENPEGRPFAELWLGAHPSSPSPAERDGRQIGLDRLLYKEGSQILGARVFDEFGGLPYLFKALSVQRPLSIQAHPNADQARLGFARENAAAAAIDPARRSYVDDRHKPELVVALSDFHSLAGFRPHREIEAFLGRTPEMGRLAPGFTASEGGLRSLCRTLMEAGPQVEAATTALLERWRGDARRRRFSRMDHRFWMLRADSELSRSGRPVAGLALIPLLNLVRLKPLQGLFVGPGQVHAHLSGAALEIMANSDNVVRAGLTPKHVDFEEFLRIACFSGERPPIVEPEREANGARLYRTEAREFELRVGRLDESVPILADPGERAALIFVLEAERGTALATPTGRWVLRAGQAWLKPRGAPWTIDGAEATVFIASTP